MDISKHKAFLLSEVKINQPGPLHIGNGDNPTIIDNQRDSDRFVQTIGKNWKSGYPGHYDPVDFNSSPFKQNDYFNPFEIWTDGDNILDWMMIDHNEEGI